jgi:SAM-dependent methyltransferase
MSVFESYARYYDLLYRDKPYRDEARYIRDLVLKHVPSARSIVELGCGTGAHAEHLAAAGLTVHGCDLSGWMLDRANLRRASLPADVASRLHFTRGDVRDVRLGLRADAVVSLFHVMSYQTENADLRAAFETAREHLNHGGVFIFDVWYGPAVLTERPTTRVKVLEDEELKIVRTAEPVMHASRNVVDVNYRIVACEKKTARYSETVETHSMRYLFSPEIELLAAEGGFAVTDAHEWLSGRAPGFDTWGVCFVCRLI